MASKYNVYWQNRLDDISQLLQEANRNGVSAKLDVSDILNYGDRGSWYGVVDAFKDGLRKGEMAHAKSLGRVVLHNKLLDSYGDSKFRLVISSGLELTAERLESGKEPIFVSAKFTERRVETIPGIRNQTGEMRVKRLVEILSEIPWGVWEHIVREEPEWYNMLPFLKKFCYGPFADLMVVTGLNDYQLKGKADMAYWPKIRRVLEISPTPKSPKSLCDILTPFYQKERLNTMKIQRLNRFLNSTLADRLWQSSPQEVSRIFPDIWKELAKIMGQKPQDKTISFAMKCLGLSLLMADEYKFDFTKIPIPVDLRVLRFTRNAGLCVSEASREIQSLWNEVLFWLWKHYPNITMIHLDSLVWQIASMGDNELQRYFEDLNISQVGVNLSSFLQTKSTPKSNKRGNVDMNSIQYSPLTFKPNITQKKVICFIPCCGSKYASGNIIKPEQILSNHDLSNAWSNLLDGRKGMQYCIDHASPKTSAINLYTGSPYNVFLPHKKEIVELIQSGGFRLIIISAGYGIIDALEPIHNYDEMMKGKVASHWRSANLTTVIADLLLQERPTHVYGFFAGESYWSTPASKYRYFFTEGVKTALEKGLNAELNGCFYRIEGRGVKAILGAIGRTFIESFKSNFDDSYVKNIYENGKWDGNVKIGFDKISL